MSKSGLDVSSSAVVFPHRTEDIDGPHRLIQGNHLVSNVAGNAIEIAGLKCLLFRADEENGPAFEQHADLLVRMLMLLDHGARSDVHDRHHHLFHGAGADIDAGKDGVTSTLFGGG